MESLPAARTSVGIQRKLAYFSNLLVWLDEYRNTQKIRDTFDGLLRNVYNRVARTTGIKGNFGAYRYPIRAIVGISGEHQPQDPATRSRCVFIHLSASKRNDSYYSKITSNMELYSGIFYNLLLRKTPEQSEKIIDAIKAIKKALMEQGIPAREAGNYAIPTACILSIKNDLEFLKWVIQEARRNHIDSSSNAITTQFLNDVHLLLAKGFIDAEYIAYSHKDSRLYFWFSGIYPQWCDLTRRSGKDVLPSDALLNLFKEEPYYVAHNQSKRMGKNKKVNRKCLVLDTNMEHELLYPIAQSVDQSLPDEDQLQQARDILVDE